MKNFIKILILVFLLGITGFIIYNYYDFTNNYNTTFHNNTFLNSENISNIQYSTIENKYKDYLNNLNFIILKNNEIVDKVYIKDLNISNNFDIEFKNILNTEKKRKFIDSLNNKNYQINLNLLLNMVTPSQPLDKNILNNLNCIKDFEKSEDAFIVTNPTQKEDYNYYIKEEIFGTEIDKNLLLQEILKQLNNIKEININNENILFEINLDSGNFYLKPEITKNDKNLLEKCETFNKYVNLDIEYIFGSDTEKVPKEIIFTWLTLNNNEINVNYDEVLKYIEDLSKKYNTKGTIRNFNSTERGLIEITKGDYGYSISQTKEAKALIEDILKGENIKKEPLYLYKGYIRNNKEDDIGNTYVEIDLSKQHLWMYKDSQLIVSSDIVTGNVSKGHTTPPGIYGLTYKQKDAVLRGPGYASPVTYWMPFNGGIGLHDATWRNSFGGNIYKSNGSHGCINMPKQNAKIIFENIEKDMPIILYN